MTAGFKLTIGDTALVEHADRGLHFLVVAVVVVVVGIYYLFDTRLDNGFSTFVAREIVDINFGVLKFAHVAAEIQDGVKLGVADVGIFRLVAFAFALIPGEIMVGVTVWCAIITDGENTIVGTDDTSANLSIGVFAAHGG